MADTIPLGTVDDMKLDALAWQVEMFVVFKGLVETENRLESYILGRRHQS